MKENKEYFVTQCLPNNGQKVIAWGYRTFCCKEDMDEEPDWHEVIFTLDVIAYKLKKYIPEDIEESILEYYEVLENWRFFDEEPFGHLIGVTKWRSINEHD